MSMDHEHRLWASFIGLGLYRLDGRTWTQPGALNALAAGPPTIALTTPQGGLWFGYRGNTLAFVGSDGSRLFGPREGVDVGDVRSIKEVKGTLWIGGKQGLQYLKHDRFVHVNLSSGAILEGVSGIVEGDDGDLWLNTMGGIFRLPRPQLDLLSHDPYHQLQFDQFGYLDGIPGLPDQVGVLPTATRMQDGRLYFSTRASVVWIDPSRISMNTIVPTVLIRSLSADRQEYDDPGVREVPLRSGTVLIRYTASSLAIPERVRFRYKLEGLESTWQDAGSQRQVAYQRLPPGHYTFLVIAANNDGLWNNAAARLSFYIAPTLFQTKTFKALCGFAFFGLLWLAYWIRIQKVTRTVRRRLTQRVEERENIARDLHDTFLQGIQGLLLSFHTATSLVPQDQLSRRMLEEALGQSDRVLQEGRRLLTQLRSTVSQSDALSDDLANAGNELRRGLPTGFRLSITGTACELHAVVREELFRVGNEAIRNAFQHASAKHVEVELVYGTSNFCLAVRDDGSGIDERILVAGGRPDHWGLPGMRERSKKIGAKLDLRSSPLGGTTVEVHIPSCLAYRSIERQKCVLSRLWRRVRGGGND